jgi:hypothetical protein
VVAGELIGAVAGERKGHLVPADLDIRMVACGLGGVGHSVDEPGRRPEVVVDEGLGDDVSPVRCQPGNSCRFWVTAALSRMLPLRWALSPP